MSLRINSDFNGVTDPDAGAYIAAVEAADGQLLEFAVGKAINDFVVGCKANGTWNAIKASCILAGARTLAGALVPLVGTAPTSFNFVAGDYNRKTGLAGNGSTKYLDSNRPANSDPQNNMHLAVGFYSATSPTVYKRLIGAYSGAGTADDFLSNNNVISHLRCRSAAPAGSIVFNSGLYGVSRASSNSFSIRIGGSNVAGATTASTAPGSRTHFVFAQNDNGSAIEITNTRLAFYSIGESLDLALLDTRVTTLINAFAAAIP